MVIYGDIIRLPQYHPEIYFMYVANGFLQFIMTMAASVSKLINGIYYNNYPFKIGYDKGENVVF